MAITEKIKSLVGLFTSDYDEDGEGIYDELEEGMNTEYPVSENVALAPEYRPMEKKMEKNNLRVISNHSYKGGYELTVIEPRAFGESAQIVNSLKENKAIIVNLHLLDKEQQQRTIDYVCGAAQALNAQPKKVGDTVFAFAPANVTLSTETNNDQTNIGEQYWHQV